MELMPHNEIYEITAPEVTVNNLIIGTPYIDIGGKQVITNKKNGDYCIMEFYKKGWTGTGYKCEGEVFNAKKQLMYKIEGKWSEQLTLINVKTGEREQVFQKNPYPENYEFMYGFSHFALQLNYFPSWLQNVVPPTDTRRRPDQRLLEEGNMKKANEEKNRLEEKQRAVRRYNEKMKIEPQAFYFDKQVNESDGVEMWKYNNKYFEIDREK